MLTYKKDELRKRQECLTWAISEWNWYLMRWGDSRKSRFGLKSRLSTGDILSLRCLRDVQMEISL